MSVVCCSFSLCISCAWRTLKSCRTCLSVLSVPWYTSAHALIMMLSVFIGSVCNVPSSSARNWMGLAGASRAARNSSPPAGLSASFAANRSLRSLYSLWINCITYWSNVFDGPLQMFKQRNPRNRCLSGHVGVRVPIFVLGSSFQSVAYVRRPSVDVGLSGSPDIL